MRVLTLLFLLFSLPLGAAERWYVFSVGGIPVGYTVEEVDGAKTRNEVFMRLTRLGRSIEMRFETTSVESAEGDLQSLDYEAMMSKQPSRVEARVEGDRVVIRSGPQERTLARGGVRLLGPQGIARMSAARLRATNDAIEYAIFSPELQRIAKATRTVVGAEPACNGAPAIRVRETIDGVPTPRTFWMNADGVPLGDEAPGPFGAMRTCLATREAALAANGTLPADLYERTVAKSNIRFADPFAVDRIVVKITRRDDALPLPALVTHNQKSLGRDADSATIEVRRNGGAATPSDEYLQPNALVESTNAAVVQVAKELTRATPHETAQELTRWVAENMTMDGGIVLAPASELIRDRRATCMGYATLLAALARAAGIPARIAMGYVYYGGIWGGHAWTEVILDGRWVPLDAAVYTPGTASAARLAAGASSFADRGGELNALLSPMFGRVDIAVLEYDERGRTHKIAADAQPFTATAHSYVNAGLGLHVAAKAWSVERAESTWPSTLVVAFRRGETVVELHHRPAHPHKPLPREGEAMYVETKGGMLWVWSARGPDAGAALREFLR